MTNRNEQALDRTQRRVEVEYEGERAVPGHLAAISDFVLSISHLPIFLGALSLAALLGYYVTNQAESLKEISQLPLLNFRTSYTPNAIYELFADLGPEGRSEYQKVNLMSTGAFPALVTLCFSMVIGQTFKKAGLPHEWNLLPLMYLAMTVLENVGIGYLLHSFPNFAPNIAALVATVAGFKFRLLTYMSLSILLGLAWWGKQSVQKWLVKKQS